MLKTKIKAFVTKVRACVKKNFDKIAMCAAMPMSMLTAEGTGTDVSGITQQITGLFKDFSVSNLVIIVGAALGIGVVLFLFWFAYRFIKRQAVKGITKGKL